MFYESNLFSFTTVFSENLEAIHRELNAILNLPLTSLDKQTWAGERPSYLETKGNKNLAWKTYVFKFFCIKHLPNLKSCPTIAKLLDQYPEIVTAEFSMLAADTHILPHRGYTNKLLRSHLGLIIPKGNTGIKVGEVTKKWSPNEWLIFDDSIVHEAWNKTSENRVVLMIDFEPNLDDVVAREVSSEILQKTNDKHMLEIAPNEKWMEWFNYGCFPVNTN
jgi:beta-hydroxylase